MTTPTRLPGTEEYVQATEQLVEVHGVTDGKPWTAAYVAVVIQNKGDERCDT